MKLILCLQCHDVYKLAKEAKRRCACGETWGYYLSDGLKAEVSNNQYTQVLGFLNNTLTSAINDQWCEGDRPDGLGRTFTAFLMPRVAPNVTMVETPQFGYGPPYVAPEVPKFEGKCTLGVGCEEAGVCYATVHGPHFDQCGRT